MPLAVGSVSFAASWLNWVHGCTSGSEQSLRHNLRFNRHSGSDERLRRTAAGQSGWLVCLLGKLHVTIPHISPGAKQRRVTGKTWCYQADNHSRCSLRAVTFIARLRLRHKACIYAGFLIVSLRFKTNPQVLQFFMWMLQCCLCEARQKVLWVPEPSPDFKSAWGWVD